MTLAKADPPKLIYSFCFLYNRQKQHKVGEAAGEPENATVMPAGTYRACVNAFNENDTVHRANRRILYRDEYLSTTFKVKKGLKA